MKKCTNCDFDFEGKFCSNCGQNAKVGNLNIHDLIHEFWHSVTHTDKGILRLIKELFLRPKQVYLNYFSGQRKNYFSPVTFYLISATLLIYVGAKIFDYEDFVHRANNPNGFNEMGRFIFQETKFKSLLLMPFEIILTWLLFKKTYNLAKNIVFWLYLYGFLFTIKFIFTPFYFAFIFQKEVIDNIIGFLTLLVIFYHLYTGQTH